MSVFRVHVLNNYLRPHLSRVIEVLSDDNLPWGHRAEPVLKNADAVFVWVDRSNALTAPLGFALGEAYCENIPVYFSAPTQQLLDEVHKNLGKLLAFRDRLRSQVGTDPKDGYERVMADADVLRPELYRLAPSSLAESCSSCGGRFKPNVQIRLSHLRALHVDCYERRINPAYADPAVFTAELVGALREDNAKLEAEIRRLSRPSYGPAAP